jgi:Flp pilus assembly protein TadG
LSHSDAGAVALEFAIVVPIMAALIFALFDLSRMVSIQQVAQSASREAARHLARSPITCTASGGSAALSAEVVQNTKAQFQVAGFEAGQIDVSVVIECRPTSSETISGIYDVEDFMPVIKVTVSLQYETVFEAIAGLNGHEITSSHQQVWTG